MATAVRKRTAHKSTVSNPPRSRYRAAAANPRRRRKAAGPTRRRRRNPGTALTKRASSNPARRKRVTRNPSPSTNAALLAIGGALVINIFDEGVNRFMPSLSNPFRIGAKAIAGYAVGTWGRKWLGSWASVAQNALWLAAALDGFNTWVRPMLGGWLTPMGAPAITGKQLVTNPTTGQLGERFFLQDGNSFDVYDGSESQMNYAN